MGLEVSKKKFGRNVFYSGVWVCELEEQWWLEMKLHMLESMDVTSVKQGTWKFQLLWPLYLAFDIWSDQA